MKYRPRVPLLAGAWKASVEAVSPAGMGQGEGVSRGWKLAFTAACPSLQPETTQRIQWRLL